MRALLVIVLVLAGCGESGACTGGAGVALTADSSSPADAGSADADPCAAMCKDEAQCVYDGVLYCNAGDAALCKPLAKCKEKGFCSLVTWGPAVVCAPGSDADCAQSDGCAKAAKFCYLSIEAGSYLALPSVTGFSTCRSHAMVKAQCKSGTWPKDGHCTKQP
jgi:hypothetical protein